VGADMPRLRVLLIDDSRTVQATLGRGLEEAVLPAGDGAIATENQLDELLKLVVERVVAGSGKLRADPPTETDELVDAMVLLVARNSVWLRRGAGLVARVAGGEAELTPPLTGWTPRRSILAIERLSHGASARNLSLRSCDELPVRLPGLKGPSGRIYRFHVSRDGMLHSHGRVPNLLMSG
jgi:hypothetical protein